MIATVLLFWASFSCFVCAVCCVVLAAAKRPPKPMLTEWGNTYSDTPVYDRVAQEAAYLAARAEVAELEREWDR